MAPDLQFDLYLLCFLSLFHFPKHLNSSHLANFFFLSPSLPAFKLFLRVFSLTRDLRRWIDFFFLLHLILTIYFLNLALNEFQFDRLNEDYWLGNGELSAASFFAWFLINLNLQIQIAHIEIIKTPLKFHKIEYPSPNNTCRHFLFWFLDSINFRNLSCHAEKQKEQSW